MVLLQKLIVAQMVKFPTSSRIRSFFFIGYLMTLSVSELYRIRWGGVHSWMIMVLKDLEGSGHDLIEVLSQHLPGKTEETMNTCQDT
jgi:hypothetical protein